MSRFLLAASLLSASSLAAQAPPTGLGADQIRQRVDRLGVLASALYMGAHPDDENTAVIAWLAQGRLARTAYLSMTRGDGGQNRIGTEQGADMGILRTQELLAARSIDGGRQFFSRAIDFGYTKSVDETLERWGHDEVLGDAVRVFRSFRPDVVITRFPGDGRGGHGQHTASAVLAREALAAAADRDAYPEQGLPPWQARRVVWNGYRIDPEKHDEEKLGPLLEVDLGSFNPVLGESYLEISARARSMHKCQGFGSSPFYGGYPNYFLHLAGDTATTDLFEGVDTTWTRVPGSEEVAELVHELQNELEPARLSGSLPRLLELRSALTSLAAESDSPWPGWKLAEVDELVAAAAGLYLDAISETPRVVAGDELTVKLVAVSRLGVGFVLDEAVLGSAATKIGTPLAANERQEIELRLPVAGDAPPTRPLWLRRPPARDTYRPLRDEDVALPIGDAAFVVEARLSLAGQELSWRLPVLYRWTDPVRGARHERVGVSPPVVARVEERVSVFPDSRPKEVAIVVRARQDHVAGEATLTLPAGWASVPASRPFELGNEGDESVLRFQVTPPSQASEGEMGIRLVTDRGEFTSSETRIDYDHFPPQVDHPPARTRLVRIPLAHRGERIGYVEGAGDEVPDALRQAGYSVLLLSDEDLAQQDLGSYDAIVLGIRAFNVRERVAALRGRLFDYVAWGGTLVVQYNTSHALVTEEVGPFPIELSRRRVTREDARVTLLEPEHPLLTEPNRITEADFEGWVQERGLYFPDHWDPHYTPLLSWSDPGEEPLEGSLLIAPYGKGIFVYTGISFFRQLPAGVPGAYRLFVNLVSARQPTLPAGDG